jgi:hypothetical protein
MSRRAVVLFTVFALLAALFAFPLLYKSAAPSGPSVVIECLDRSLEGYATYWQNEIGRRYPNSVGILVHGGDFIEGQWIVGSHFAPHRHVTPIQEIVQHYQKLYPTRKVVLLACNTGHLKLGIKGVPYAMASVWCIPDRELKPEHFATATQTIDQGGIVIITNRKLDTRTRWQTRPDVVGNIFEFVEE